MKDSQIEKRLKNIIETAPLDLLEEIKEKPVVKMLRHDEITRQERKKPLVHAMIPFASAALLLFIFGSWYRTYQVVDSEIYLDVNPSIELRTNRKNEVIGLHGSNEEGEILLKDLAFQGKSYEEVTELILEELIEEGYLSRSEEVLLLSVFSKDQRKEEEKLTRLDDVIHEYLKSREIIPILLNQRLEKTSAMENYAKEYDISISKMTFIRNLMILQEGLKVEDLVKMSLEELVLLSRNLELDLGRIIESEDLSEVEKLEPEEMEKPDDQPSGEEGRTRITIQEARRIALGRTGGRIVEEDLDEDSYEFEIHTAAEKHELEIDAFTGRVLDHDREAWDDDDDDDDDDTDDEENDDNDDDEDDDTDDDEDDD
ncbi:PepSY domain-containing protein [Proteiniclasticum ruminis]|uniref:PepSY domain-containing protein n=2 Tax=Proteiniclasticum ruminis TaxID=398199 RepID=UPI0028A99C28|nr:PepSY domain-containing protein [Proteiniclasticum ruminis]